MTILELPSLVAVACGKQWELLEAVTVCVQYFMEIDLWKKALYIACIIFLIVKYFAVTVEVVYLHVCSEVKTS